jgi:CheY-like chemotaxis protein
MNDRKKIVLIVEDEEDLREFFQESLSSFGYEVFTSSNGKAALECLQAGLIPDVIISDLMMPEMNGWEFAQALRDSATFNQIPLIIVSALIDKSPPENSRCCLAKPFKLNELLQTIEKHAY